MIIVLLGVGIGVVGSLLCGLAVPLCRYLRKMEARESCQRCERFDDCIAWKKMPLVHTSVIEEWMLYAFVRVKKKCPKVGNCPLKYRFVCSFLGFLLYLITFWSEGFDMMGIVWGMSVIALFFLAIVDWNTQYIPFECNIFIFICGLIHLFADFSNWLEYLIGLIAVSGFLFMVDRIATPVLRKKYPEDEVDSVIGDGDIKLMAATGLLLGWKLNFIALGIGCISGSVIHLIRMKIKGSGAKLALGPYLSLGVYITMICGEQLVSWYLNMLGLYPV